MAKTNTNRAIEYGQLYFVAPDVELAEIVDSALDIYHRFPEIAARITNDLLHAALADKQSRETEKAWQASKVDKRQKLLFETLPGGNAIGKQISLGDGRPRMSVEVVFVLMQACTHFGGIYSRTTAERLADSVTLRAYLSLRNLTIPAPRTIGDQVACLSGETLALIHSCQMAYAQAEQLDSFDEFIADSTSVAANVKWPTDSGLMAHLLWRSWHAISKLNEMELVKVTPHWMNTWVEKAGKLNKQINMAQKNAKRRKSYRQLLDTANNALWHMSGEIKRVRRDFLAACEAVSPLVRERLLRFWDQVVEDLQSLCRVFEQTRERIKNKKVTPADKRVLSVSDLDAAYISKGDRDPVVGYKPQLAISGNCLVTAFSLQPGNTSDSKSLLPLVDMATERTGVLPTMVIADDGYSSNDNRNTLQAKGVEHVVISGAKGRRITPEEEWQSATHAEARNKRSAVESAIFTLKYTVYFDQIGSRGIAAVRAELMRKILLYNFSRLALLRKRKQEAERASRAMASQRAA